MTGKSILIIEDNATNRELMSYLLRAFGYRTMEAADGEAGVEIARRESPDLIICDVQMPRMDGFEVARRLKSHPALRRIPLIAITAFAMVGDRDKILSAGFDGYIPKPITPETFVEQVESFFRTEVKTDSERPGLGRGNGRTILVVDNSPVNIALARSTLEPFGYAVLSAENVSSGLGLALDHHPDLILSDIHMPAEDGFDFIRRVKAESSLGGIPFVFISSTVMGYSDEARAMSLGAAKFILRPIEPAVLVDEIDDCLNSTDARENRKQVQ